MDPATILSIAGTSAALSKIAWQLGEGLYIFFSDVKFIDQTVLGLISEVKALSSACALVDDRLRDIVQEFDSELRTPAKDRSKLWDCIKAQLNESEKSISQLGSAFETAQKSSTNSVIQMWRQVKLNMQAKDIDEARNRIRSHTASLQTILQTVAMYVSSCHALGVMAQADYLE